MRILIKTTKADIWTEVESASYSAETDLQKMIASSPGIIPVDEIKSNMKPFCLAVREYGLPGSGNTDILLFNATGDIGIIECKLASNAEIKRKVIGQILEYAAYLWNTTYEELDETIKAIKGQSIAENVASASPANEWDEELFRESIIQTLNEGTFNLIIAVDAMNEELSRTIKYLNECGNTSFSFHALELNRYKTEGVEMLVPRLHGEVPQNKQAEKQGRRIWDKERFFEQVEKSLSEEAMVLISDLYEWSKAKAHRLYWGRGTETGSFTFHHVWNNKTISVFSVYSSGMLLINFGYLTNHIEKSLLEQFYKQLIAIRSFSKLPERYSGFPSVNLSGCTKEDIDGFKNVVLSVVAQLK